MIAVESEYVQAVVDKMLLTGKERQWDFLFGEYEKVRAVKKPIYIKWLARLLANCPEIDARQFATNSELCQRNIAPRSEPFLVQGENTEYLLAAFALEIYNAKRTISIVGLPWMSSILLTLLSDCRDVVNLVVAYHQF